MKALTWHSTTGFTPGHEIPYHSPSTRPPGLAREKVLTFMQGLAGLALLAPLLYFAAVIIGYAYILYLL